ncbi:MAG TPA: hypothetical protein HPQ00_01340 [Magnetococcales bacterium]|nr:hypothetical protein [Magnetococcales bacterium]
MKSKAKYLLWGNLSIIAILVFCFPKLMISPGHLIEEHTALESACFSCHEPFFGISSQRCISCHKVDTIGTTTTKGVAIVRKKAKIRFHHRLKGQDCTDCHSDHTGVAKYRPTARFAHEVLDSSLRSQCEECHQRPIDPLHRPITSPCSQCHRQDKWKPAQFRHDQLSAAEQELCTDCHKNKIPTDPLHRQVSSQCNQCHGKDKWKPAKFKHDMLPITKRERCIDCHQHKLPADPMHRHLSTPCGSCHTVTHWKPATMDHKPWFELDKNHLVACVRCHPANNYKAYTCYDCHEHSVEKIRSEHAEEGIRNYERCVQCHRNANEDDAKSLWKSGGDRGRHKGEEEDDD